MVKAKKHQQIFTYFMSYLVHDGKYVWQNICILSEIYYLSSDISTLW